MNPSQDVIYLKELLKQLVYKRFIKELMKERIKTINYFFNNYKTNEVKPSFEECEQAYTDTLLKMCDKYYEGKFTVTTMKKGFNYFYFSLSNTMKTIHNSKRTSRVPAAIETFYEDNHNNPVNNIDLVNNVLTGTTLIDNVTDYLLTRYTLKQVNIFRAKYKSNDSQVVIAKKFGKSEVAISNLLAKMLKDTRKKFKNRLIDEYGD